MQSLMLMFVPVLSFAIAALSLPLVKRLARRSGITATPYSDSEGAESSPLLGGVSIVAAILISLTIAGALPGWMLGGTLGLFVVGLIDDAIVLKPLRKFLMQVAVVLFVVAAGPRFGLAPWPLVGASLAAFWLLSTVNAFNLIDGLDGLAAGVGIAASAAIAVIGATHGDMAMTFQGLAIGGALAGFLLFNLYPASIFMGDCGALALGLLLGAIALRAGGLAALQSRPSRYVVPILVMLVPLLDIAIVSVSRMATGSPISRRGLDHSHHRLLLLGLSERRAVGVCWGVASLSAVCAVVLAIMPHFYVVATLPFIALAAALMALFMIDLTFDSNAPGIAYDNLRGPARFILTFAYKRRLAEASLDFVLILAAYFGAFLIRLDFKMNDILVEQMVGSAPWVLLATYVAFLAAGVYRGMWRYAGFADVLRFANGSLLAGILLLVGSLFTPTLLSGTIEVLFVILLFNLLVGSRLSFRTLRKGIALLEPASERVLIVGIGELGEAAARYIASLRSQSLRLVGFADDDGFKLGKVVHGRPVLGSLDDLEKIHAASQFNQILVATETLAADRMRLVLAFANLHHVAVRKFSIKLSEVEPAGEAAGQNSAAGPVAEGTSAPGKVVARSSTLG